MILALDLSIESVASFARGTKCENIYNTYKGETLHFNKPTTFFRPKAKPSDLTDFHGPKVALLTRSHCALYRLLLSVTSFKYIENAKPTAAY